MAANPVTSGQSESWPQHSCEHKSGSRSAQAAALESGPKAPLNFMLLLPVVDHLDKTFHLSSIVGPGMQVYRK